MKLQLLFICFTLSVLTMFEIQAQANASSKSMVELDGESYRSFGFNASWGNNATSQAYYFEGKYRRTYACWIDNYGNVTVGCYDHDTKVIDTHIVKENFEVNEQNSPSIVINSEGKLMLFFSKQNQKGQAGMSPVFYTKTELSENIHSWSESGSLLLPSSVAIDGNSPTSFNSIFPIQLSEENGKIHLFVHQGEGKLVSFWSTNNGTSWSTPQVFLQLNQGSNSGKYSIRVGSNGVDKIHFIASNATTDNNQIVYAYYEDNSIYNANGKGIGTMSSLPVSIASFDLIYQSNDKNLKTTCWDIAENKEGNPVIVYSNYSKNNEQLYSYATYTGKKWQNSTICEKEIASSIDESPELNFNLLGGASLDKENPSEVYLSVHKDSIWEIEHRQTQNAGKSWKMTPITSKSSKNNIRPIAINGAKQDSPIQMLWMQITTFHTSEHASIHHSNWANRFQSAVKINEKSPLVSSPLQPEQIKSIMRQTADWQFANPYDLNRLTDWHWGTYFVGVQALYELTGDERYKQEMINVGDHAKWRLNDQILYADMLTIISNWAWLYGLEHNEKMIENSRWACDVHLRTRRHYRADVTFEGNKYFDEWWTWCDALFVAPTSFARMSKETGDQRYVEYADKMFWKTADYIYSPVDSLMFRDDRYFEQRSENGKKIFWGRGNGWVIAALSRMMTLLPENHASRPKYEKMFHDMSERLFKLQGDDHLWRVSLLDPEYQDEGEVSGSAFNVYALAWGINNGLVDKRYTDQVEKAWVALCENVNANGRLGNVQAEGVDPFKFTEDDWAVYGTGAYLMAGREMYLLESKVIAAE